MLENIHHEHQNILSKMQRINKLYRMGRSQNSYIEKASVVVL